jgi:enterochelin esterase-like enzyme
MDLQHLSIVGMPFLIGLGVVAGACFAAAVLVARRVWMRVLVGFVGLVFTVATVGGSINAHYDYFPTLGALLGRTAADQISMSHFRELERMARTRARGALVESHPAHEPNHGVVIPFRMPGTVSGFAARTGQVYLPAAWFRSPRPFLPVIELLHGSPGSPADWTRGGLADVTADNFAHRHGGIAPVIVMPDVNGSWWTDTECTNGKRGNADTYLTVDVRRAVVARFGVDPRGSAWAVAGLSEGGTCALELALRHPGLFAAAGDFSGDTYPSTNGGMEQLFAGSPYQVDALTRAYDPRAILASWHHHRYGPAIFLSVGRSDPTLSLPALERFRAQVVADGLTEHIATVGGSHDFRVWRQSFEVALPWFMEWLHPEASRGALVRRPESMHRVATVRANATLGRVGSRRAGYRP